MRIGWEGRVLTSRIGGIGRYAIRLLETLAALKVAEAPDLELLIFAAPQTERPLLNALPVRVCERFRWSKSTLLRSSLLLTAGTMLERIALFHALEPAGYPLLYSAGKLVVTVHDITPLTLPWAFPPRHRWIMTTAFARLRERADMVIVPSAATAADVAQHLGIAPERLTVIPLGCEPRFQPRVDAAHAAAVRQRYRLPERYVLFVGTLEPRKNLGTLLQAFALFQAEGARGDVKLVIAGARGWGQEPYDAIVDRLGIRQQVRYVGFVADADLPELYRGAEVFVYPSLYEGFGLPILEAMACGTPVITSNRSSLPEVAGQAALLIDPTQPEALAAAISTVVSDRLVRQELHCKGLVRAKAFTWEAAARRTLEIYRRVGVR